MTKPIRPIRIEGNIAFVPLTQGYEAIIDATDVPLVSGRNWCAMVCSGGNVYAKATAKNKTIQMHRHLMGEPEGLRIDHKDGDGLNNRRTVDGGNLRLATAQQNAMNSRLGVRNTSGFKGVTFHKQTGKWQAQIIVGKKMHYLGLHDAPDKAHIAYVEASAELHGNFGRTS